MGPRQQIVNREKWLSFLLKVNDLANEHSCCTACLWSHMGAEPAMRTLNSDGPVVDQVGAFIGFTVHIDLDGLNRCRA